MKLHGRFLVFFFLIAFRSHATHIVGGDIAVQWISGNDFHVTLTFFRDCGAGNSDFDGIITIGVYDKQTNSIQQSFILGLSVRDTLQLGDSCFTPLNVCIERGLYEGIVSIPNNPNGYYVAWQRCCRNHIILNIQNPGSAGMVFYSEIADPSMHNNSPVFGSYPNAYMCVNSLNTKSFVCNDADGDSLVYSLVTPMNGYSTQSMTGQPGLEVLNPGPYPPILWQTPYSPGNMIGGIPPMSIDPNTGIITAHPANTGVYVFAVRVQEFRNGIKIGEVRRDIQYRVVNCPMTTAPVFTSPVATTISAPSADTTFNIIAGDVLSFDVSATSVNPNDSIFLYGTSELFTTQVPGINASFRNDSSIGTVLQNFYLQTSCDAIRDEPYHIRFDSNKNSCYGILRTSIEADIFVKSPFDGAMDTLVPNVFTPDNDGKNDYYHIKATPNYCFDKFEMKIFNRWGLLVYETNDFLFQWDGKDPGDHKLSEGVYYYILDATFRNSSFNKKGVIHLRM